VSHTVAVLFILQPSVQQAPEEHSQQVLPEHPIPPQLLQEATPPLIWHRPSVQVATVVQVVSHVMVASVQTEVPPWQ
jgi:hypothetical protein